MRVNWLLHARRGRDLLCTNRPRVCRAGRRRQTGGPGEAARSQENGDREVRAHTSSSGHRGRKSPGTQTDLVATGRQGSRPQLWQ
eukprot:4525340-Pyramimonas_sp.AAC.1